MKMGLVKNVYACHGVGLRIGDLLNFYTLLTITDLIFLLQLLQNQQNLKGRLPTFEGVEQKKYGMAQQCCPGENRPKITWGDHLIFGLNQWCLVASEGAIACNCSMEKF